MRKEDKYSMAKEIVNILDKDEYDHVVACFMQKANNGKMKASLAVYGPEHAVSTTIYELMRVLKSAVNSKEELDCINLKLIEMVMESDKEL